MPRITLAKSSSAESSSVSQICFVSHSECRNKTQGPSSTTPLTALVLIADSLHICKAPGPVCGPPVCTPRSRLDQCQKYFKCHSDGTCFFDSQSCLAGEGCSQFYRQCEDGEGCEYKMCEVGEAYCDYRCDDGICEKLDLVGRCAADDTECIQFFQYFDSGGSGGGGGGSSGSGSSGGSSSSSGSGSSGGSSSSGSDSNSSSGSGSNSDGSNSDGSNSDGSSGGNSVANRDIVAGNGNAVSQQAKFKSMIFYLLPVVAAALIIAYAVWPRVSDSHLESMIACAAFSTNFSLLYFCRPSPQLNTL
jgi:hypothetical protein